MAFHTPVTMVELRMEAGARFRQDLTRDSNDFVYVIDGSGTFGRGATPGHKDQTPWLERTHTDRPGALTITAATPLRVLLFAGQPLREPVVVHGPFVMNTEQEIVQSFADYQSGCFEE